MRLALRLTVRATVVFVLYWVLAPVILWVNERQTHFIESCVFGAVAAFIPWRRAWRTGRSHFGSVGETFLNSRAVERELAGH